MREKNKTLWTDSEEGCGSPRDARNLAFRAIFSDPPLTFSHKDGENGREQ